MDRLSSNPQTQEAHKFFDDLVEEVFGDEETTEETPEEEDIVAPGSDSEYTEDTPSEEAAEDGDEPTEDPPKDDSLAKALEEARAELAKRQQRLEEAESKLEALVTQTKLPEIPVILPLDQLPEEAQRIITDEARRFGLDPDQHAWNVQRDFQRKVEDERAAIQQRIQSEHQQVSQDIYKAMTMDKRLADNPGLGPIVSKILTEAQFEESLKDMYEAGATPKSIEKYAMRNIEQAYKFAELELKQQSNRDRLKDAVAKQKSQLKKATRGEATRSGSTGPSVQTKSSQEKTMDDILEEAFSVKFQNPLRRLLG